MQMHQSSFNLIDLRNMKLKAKVKSL